MRHLLALFLLFPSFSCSLYAQWVMQIEKNNGASLEIPVDDVSSIQYYYRNIDGWQNPSPIITVIDDDTLYPDHIKQFHDLCEDNGIVGTWACIARRGEYIPEIWDLLHKYEKEGYHIATHCYDQQNYYRWSQNLDIEVRNVSTLRWVINISTPLKERHIQST